MLLERTPEHKDIDLLPVLTEPLLNNWNKKEKALFAEAVLLYGKDYAKITEHLGGLRTLCQTWKFTEKLTKRL